MRLLAKICAVSMAVIAAAAPAYAENERNVTRDFTFGIKKKASVMPLSDNPDGHETFERFLEMKNELPDEIPIFEPYDVNYENCIFMSNDGSDSGSGSIDDPIKTFEEAFRRTAASSKKSEGFTIFLREGNYDVSKGLKIPEEISGSDKAPVIISGYKDEKVSLVGGISLTGKDFKPADNPRLPDSVKGKVYTANLKELGYEIPEITPVKTPVLVADGVDFSLARFPNSEETAPAKYTGEDGTDGVIDPGSKKGESPQRGFEFQFKSKRPLSWENDGNIWMHGSFAVDWVVRNYQIKSINKDKNSIKTVQYEMWGDGAKYNLHNHYYYFNVLEELDIPGEWYIDYTTGDIYMYPISGIDGISVDIALTSEDLVTFEGGTHNVVLNGLEVKSGNGKGIVVAGYRNVVQRCKVNEVSGTAVTFDRSKNCGLISSEINGNVGVTYHKTYDSVSMDEVALTPTCNFIQNNYVMNGQISLRYGVQDIVSHNSVINCPGMCIYVAQQMESIIEYNEVVGGPHVGVDAGMIYVEGMPDNRGNHVRYNYLHDAQLEPKAATHGIYFDDTVSGNFAYGNILDKADFYAHGGSDHVIYGNVIVDKKNNTSISNSNNYSKGGMQNVYIPGYMKVNPDNMMMQINGRYKLTGGVWKQRYPTLENWYFWILQLREEYKRDSTNYVNTDLYKKIVSPKWCAYKNNIIFNSTKPNSDNNFEIKPWWDNNVMLDESESDIFADYENRVFDIADEAKIKKLIPDYEKIPPQSRRGVITADNLIKEKLALDGIKLAYPVVNSEQRILPYNIGFTWSDAPGAAYYTVKIAKNEDMTDLVGEYVTKYNYYTLNDELEVGTKYYWKVVAAVDSQAMDKTPVTSETAYFYTYTYAEAAAVAELDTSAYDEKVAELKKVCDEVTETEDTSVNTYKTGTKSELEELLNTSAKRIKKLALQREIEEETKAVEVSFYGILSKNKNCAERTYSVSDISMWKYNPEIAELTVNGDEAVVKSKTNSSCIAYDERPLAPGETVKLKMNFGAMENWDAFGIKQVETDGKNMITSAKGYYIVVKKDYIELQKYPNKGIICSAENNSSIIVPNTWHDIEVSCTPEGSNNHIIFKVDGNTVFDYVDSQTQVYELGRFSIQAFSGGIKFK